MTVSVVVASHVERTNADALKDLTFCHLHMTNRDFLIFDTFENPSTYLSGELSDEEMEIPAHEIPPNPDDSDSKRAKSLIEKLADAL